MICRGGSRPSRSADTGSCVNQVFREAQGPPLRPKAETQSFKCYNIIRGTDCHAPSVLAMTRETIDAAVIAGERGVRSGYSGICGWEKNGGIQKLAWEEF